MRPRRLASVTHREAAEIVTWWYSLSAFTGIGGYEIGVIGAFNAAVFDTNSFQHLSTHL
jgi:hypothetical protein